MTNQELAVLIQIAGRIGGDWTEWVGLCVKVRPLVTTRSSLRMIAAATIFHVWLLRGRPDRARWEYRSRVRWALGALQQYTAQADEEAPPAPAPLASALPN